MAAETAVHLHAMGRDFGALSHRELELEREVGECKDQLAKLRDDHALLESLIESLVPGYAETRKDLGGGSGSGGSGSGGSGSGGSGSGGSGSGGGDRPAKLSDRPIDGEEKCGAMDLQMDLGHEQKVYMARVVFCPLPLAYDRIFFSSERASRAAWSKARCIKFNRTVQIVIPG